MLRRIILIILFPFVLSISAVIKPAFSGTLAVEYLCEFGVAFYRMGKYDDALMEFKKVLIIDPSNQTAKEYIGKIFQEGISPVAVKEELAPSPVTKEPPKLVSREEVMDKILASLGKKTLEEKLERKPAVKAGLKISGETQVRLGMTSQDTVWKRANFDLNERNWRTISNAALNRRENTYDTRVYDRLRVNLDTTNEEGLGFHSNITVDPWSFTGKSNKITLNSGGDAVELELKYWSNTGYTLDETLYTLRNGDALALPEIKMISGHTASPVSIATANTWTGNAFTLNEIKIERQFQPLRELWFDYKQDNLKLRLYPLAFEDQALTFDDPLRLSNNRIWWEGSPWLHSWKRGQLNSTVPDFTKGYWDNDLSSRTRDSEGRRLTGLRGFSFEFRPQEETSIATSIAAPKTLWQDYAEIDNFLSATRLKQSLTENLRLGVSATTRLGLNLAEENSTDARNYLVGTDLGYEVIDGLKLNFEAAHSQSKYDLTNAQYHTDLRGYAYYFSILGRFPFRSIMDTERGYDGIQPEKDESSFTKFRFFASRMDDSFDASLSSYVETRDDEWWSRHIHFRKPLQHYYGGIDRLLTWDDIKDFRIGNGIDIGRTTLGFRMESFIWDKKIENLFDVRNVHGVDSGKFVENVAREELTYNVNDKLTTKLLGIYHRLPHTYGGIDPYFFDAGTRRFFTNNQIEDNKDPSLSVRSLGLEYEFFDWLALNGIWEYTNDIALGLANFPRGILKDDTMRAYTFRENNNNYRDFSYFLYSQQYFPKPPYPYYNVFKAGLTLKPVEKLEIYLDYTRNPYEKAGPIDDNMNHVGLSASYAPISKIGLFFNYNYSRWQDLDSISQGITKVFGHHNLFSEFVYRLSENEDFALQYGEGSRNPYMGGIIDMSWDPYGGSLKTIDTQHIFRMYYRRNF